jgi:hypothetical protein
MDKSTKYDIWEDIQNKITVNLGKRSLSVSSQSFRWPFLHIIGEQCWQLCTQKDHRVRWTGFEYSQVTLSSVCENFEEVPQEGEKKWDPNWPFRFLLNTQVRLWGRERFIQQVKHKDTHVHMQAMSTQESVVHTQTWTRAHGRGAF